VGFAEDGWCGEDYDLATRCARLGYKCASVRDDPDHASALHQRHRSNAISTSVARKHAKMNVMMTPRPLEQLQLRATEDRLKAGLLAKVFRFPILDAMLDDDEDSAALLRQRGGGD